MGASRTGKETSYPQTTVDRSRSAIAVMELGRKKSSANALSFAPSVTSSSAPPSMKSKQTRGSLRLASRRRSRTDGIASSRILSADGDRPHPGAGAAADFERQAHEEELADPGCGQVV